MDMDTAGVGRPLRAGVGGIGLRPVREVVEGAALDAAVAFVEVAAAGVRHLREAGRTTGEPDSFYTWLARFSGLVEERRPAVDARLQLERVDPAVLLEAAQVGCRRRSAQLSEGHPVELSVTAGPL